MRGWTTDRGHVQVVEGKLTCMIAASTDQGLARRVQGLFAQDSMRINLSSDVLGVEVCGALKNVLAIAAGIVEGKGLGSNALAAVVRLHPSPCLCSAASVLTHVLHLTAAVWMPMVTLAPLMVVTPLLNNAQSFDHVLLQKRSHCWACCQHAPLAKLYRCCGKHVLQRQQKT